MLQNAITVSLSKQEVSESEIPLICLSKSLLMEHFKTLFEGLKTSFLF